jgi:hypothetical protein
MAKIKFTAASASAFLLHRCFPVTMADLRKKKQRLEKVANTAKTKKGNPVGKNGHDPPHGEPAFLGCWFV